MPQIANSGGAIIALFAIGLVCWLISRIGRAALPTEERRALDRQTAKNLAREKKAMGCVWTVFGIVLLIALLGLALSR
jgi:hypothetical protein